MSEWGFLQKKAVPSGKKAVLGSAVAFPLDVFTPGELEALKRKLTLKKRESVHFAFGPSKDKRDEVLLYRQKGNWIIFPRRFGIEYAKANGVELEDRRSEGEAVQIAFSEEAQSKKPLLKSKQDPVVEETVRSLKETPWNSGILQSGTGTGKCCAKGTLVDTQRGLVPIEEIRVGDVVESFDSERLCFERREVSAVYGMGFQPTKKVHLSYGLSVEVTPEHPLWSPDGWRQAVQLRVGDRVGASLRGVKTWNKKVGLKNEYRNDESDSCSGLLWLRVDAIEDSYADVYDITVPHTHSFLANGIICHNTVMGIKIACALGRKTLIVVNNQELLQQWLNHMIGSPTGANPEIQPFTDLRREDIGIIQEEKREIPGKKVVLGMMQTLINREFTPEERRAFGLVIWDECLDGDSLVMTRDGEIPIREIVKRRRSVQVLSYDESRRKFAWKRVTNWFDQGEREVIRVNFDGGRFIDCTEEHPVLVLRNRRLSWIPAGDLRKGDVVKAVKRDCRTSRARKEELWDREKRLACTPE
jgi:hypothetical protein